ncbi:hypothetical protein [Cupriavidus agavae]|uniref:Glycosyltransferase RgtA/B/C/D-like domain-containing protein n=1 Tax=Cupriavidus agavae TaxID=1001822 RepID=A0A4Q7S960_9BURK|nr:hypothetical protein [Cupriavidus agavae]RZT42328.1 hypothetical protein EV147_1358 [Cupriavidus agavae]
MRSLSVGPALSAGVTRTVAAGAIASYGLVYLNARRLLPDTIFRDAEKIEQQMAGADTYAGSSFDVAGQLFTAIGAGLDPFVMGIGAWLLWFLYRDARRPGLMAAATLLGVACVFFNLFVASKDTLVVAMALLVATGARQGRPIRMWLALLLPYTAYAVLLRPYYALILGLALALYLLTRLGPRRRIVALGVALLALMLVPPAILHTLQVARDLAVQYLQFQSPYGARTSFLNPYPLDSLPGFIGNYLYACLRLNLTVLWHPGVKEAAMQFWLWLAAWPAFRAVAGGVAGRAQASPASLPACLVMAHVAVSMLFEPDLGSYMRHLSALAPLSMLLLRPVTRQ